MSNVDDDDEVIDEEKSNPYLKGSGHVFDDMDLEDLLSAYVTWSGIILSLYRQEKDINDMPWVKTKRTEEAQTEAILALRKLRDSYEADLKEGKVVQRLIGVDTGRCI